LKLTIAIAIKLVTYQSTISTTIALTFDRNMASFYCAFRMQSSKSSSMLFLGVVSSVFLLGRIEDYKQYTPQQTFLLGWHQIQLGNKPCLYLLLLLLPIIIVLISLRPQVFILCAFARECPAC